MSSEMELLESELNSLVNIPVPKKPNSSPFFTGRKDVLDKLRKIFVHHPNNRLTPRRSCLLWGMGGIGKTQICLRFIEEMSEWGISSLSAAQDSGTVVSALQWISCIQEEWLMVFDDANEPPEVMAKFIPYGDRGNILITSRNRSMGRIISSQNNIEITEMEEPDAIALLLRVSCLDPSAENIQAATGIVAALGFIPLAVDQAGAYIEAGKCDINKYLRRLSRHHQILMSDAAFTGASNYNQTVYGTWDLSFEEIERRANGESSTGNAQAAHAAIQILQTWAVYHYSNISTKIFKSAAESKHDSDSEVAGKLPLAITLLDHTLLALDSDGYWDDSIFGQGVSVLVSFSLIRREHSSEIFSIHPVLHTWSREKISKYKQQKIWEMGSIILSCAIPRGFTSQDYALRHLIFPHIKANELYGHQLGFISEYYDDKYTNFAQVMEEHGDWKNAEKLQVKITDMRNKILGAEHPLTLLSMASLASTYRNQGRWNEAEQLDIQVMDMMKKLYDIEHPYTLLSMANLASTYRNQKRWNEAEQLEVQVVDMMKKLVGEEHPVTLTSMANLACTYRNMERYSEAEQLEVQVMSMRKTLLGVEHPHTFLSMTNLASTYRRQERWGEAEQLDAQVMDMTKKLLGAEHPYTLISMGNLASSYGNQGRWNEEEQLEIQVMTTMERLFGVEHHLTLTSMANLAITYWNQGKWTEAEQLEVQVMNMRKKVLGEEHSDTLSSMENLAVTYRNQGKWIEAEQLEVLVMDIRKKVLGEEHSDTLSSMENLAITYSNQGKWIEAEQLEVQVMDIRKKVLGEEHPDTLSTMVNLASTYRNQVKWNKAEQLNVQVMNIKKKVLGEEHPDTLTSMENLAITYWNQRRYNEAEQLDVQVIDMRKKVLGGEHPDTLTSMENLASAYRSQKRGSEAKQLDTQVMDIKNKLLDSGREYPDTLSSLENSPAALKGRKGQIIQSFKSWIKKKIGRDSVK